MKNTVSPKITKGLQISMEDTEAEAGVVICRIDQGFPLSQKVKVMGLREFLKKEIIHYEFNELWWTIVC